MSTVLRFIRFFAWLDVVASAIVLVGTILIYAPCFTGSAETCLSGVLLLPLGVFVLAVGGVGVLVLALTRPRQHSRRPPPRSF